MVTIPLTFDEAKKFHADVVEKVLLELKKSESKHKNAKPDKIQWAYSYELVSAHADGVQDTDAREMRRSVDRKIRLAKLKHLNEVEKANSWKKAKPTVEVKSTDEINREIQTFFSNVITLSLMMKIDNYERFYKIEKTSLFESKIKEDIEHGNFVF